MLVLPPPTPRCCGINLNMNPITAQSDVPSEKCRQRDKQAIVTVCDREDGKIVDISPRRRERFSGLVLPQPFIYSDE